MVEKWFLEVCVTGKHLELEAVDRRPSRVSESRQDMPSHGEEDGNKQTTETDVAGECIAWPTGKQEGHLNHD